MGPPSGDFFERPHQESHMATKAPAAKPAAPAKAGNVINRKRRNTLERKCLSKQFKVLFSGSSGAVYRNMLAAWKEARRKTGPSPRDA